MSDGGEFFGAMYYTLAFHFFDSSLIQLIV